MLDYIMEVLLFFCTFTTEIIFMCMVVGVLWYMLNQTRKHYARKHSSRLYKDSNGNVCLK